jgi:hypothetical protein
MLTEVSMTVAGARSVTGFPPRSKSCLLRGIACPPFATLSAALATGAAKPTNSYDVTNANTVPPRAVTCGVLVEVKLTEGRRSGVSGTPTFIVDGKPVVGAVGLSEFEKMVDAGLATRAEDQ